jgi:hypothetical protein
MQSISNSKTMQNESVKTQKKKKKDIKQNEKRPSENKVYIINK